MELLSIQASTSFMVPFDGSNQRPQSFLDFSDRSFEALDSIEQSGLRKGNLTLNP